MPPITLAVVPSTTPGDRRTALAALCAELGRVLGEEVRALTPATYGELISELEKDRVHYAWMSPALAVIANEEVQVRPLLSAVRNDRTVFRSAMFVDAGSPAMSVDDLRGKTVAWVDRASAAGYLYPRLELAARGIDPTRFFGNELFLSSHAEVVRAVFDGRADVGATYAEPPPRGEQIRRSGFTDAAPKRSARVLMWTGEIPNDVIVGHGLLTAADHRVFSNAILTLAEREHGRQLLYNAFHAEQFASVPKSSLREIGELVRLAREHGLLAHL